MCEHSAQGVHATIVQQFPHEHTTRESKMAKTVSQFIGRKSRDGVKRHKIRDNIRFAYIGDPNFSLGQLTVILLRVQFSAYFAFARIMVKEVNAT